MSSDVFLISAIAGADCAEAIRQAVERAGMHASRVQDAIFAEDRSTSAVDFEDVAHTAGLTCPVVSISSSLRAMFFAAQSILSGDIEIAVVTGQEQNAAGALLLAAPEAVGRWNLIPRARLAARSLAGVDPALRAAEITSNDISVVKTGANSIDLLIELIAELEAQQVQWGMLSVGEAALLMERV